MTERGRRSEGPFSPYRISPTRLNTYSECGVRFKRYYIDNEPMHRMGSAALFGKVIHHAMEHWTPDRSQDLLNLVKVAWGAETQGSSVLQFLGKYAALSVQAIEKEQAIRDSWAAKGKESKAPRMTKEWKESAIAKKIALLIEEWTPLLNAESQWEFTERDPLPALYDESLVLAKRIQTRLGGLPPSLHTEFEFTEAWQGFYLNGYIDVIEPILSKSGELVGIGVLDYKTYRKIPAPQIKGDGDGGDAAELKDYRQLVIYDVVTRLLRNRGVLALPSPAPLYVGVDYLRAGERRWWKMTTADHQRLHDELKMFNRGVEAGVFLPASKSTNPNFCDYGPTCCLRQAASGQATRVSL